MEETAYLLWFSVGTISRVCGSAADAPASGTTSDRDTSLSRVTVSSLGSIQYAGYVRWMGAV